MQRFILMVEGMNFEDLDEVELLSLPSVDEPIETRFGTCLIVRTEAVAEGSAYAGRIICRLP